MKLKAHEAIQLLQRSYKSDEYIFIWFYSFDEFDGDMDCGSPISQQDWDDAIDNCDLIDVQIKDSIRLILNDNES